jgi:hypothetical protein
LRGTREANQFSGTPAVRKSFKDAVRCGSDQLHIQVGCLLPTARFALAAAAPKVPMGEWVRIGAVVPHTMLWGLRIRGTDLSSVQPFPLAFGATDQQICVLWQQVALGHKIVSSLPEGSDIGFLRGITLFNRKPWITGRNALGSGRGERNEAALQIAQAIFKERMTKLADDWLPPAAYPSSLARRAL